MVNSQPYHCHPYLFCNSLLIDIEKLIYFSVFSPKTFKFSLKLFGKSFDYKMIIICRTIMTNNRNIICYFIIHITLVMSSSCIFPCKMTMISYLFIIFKKSFLVYIATFLIFIRFIFFVC